MQNWNPMYGQPRRDESGGGAAVVDRPKVNPSVDHTGGTRSPKTVAIHVVDAVQIGDEKITGEVEPRHDPLYERQTVSLVREGDRLTNSADVEFRSSLKWPGPLAAFVVYDEQGSITHRYEMSDKINIPADYVLNLRKGAGNFVKCGNPNARQ